MTKFWEFVAHWAVCVRNPSDLGYSNDAFKLPNLNLIEHIVASPPTDGYLVAMRAETLSERRTARKESMEKRVEEARRLVSGNNDSGLYGAITMSNPAPCTLQSRTARK